MHERNDEHHCQSGPVSCPQILRHPLLLPNDPPCSCLARAPVYLLYVRRVRPVGSPFDRSSNPTTISESRSARVASVRIWPSQANRRGQRQRARLASCGPSAEIPEQRLECYIDQNSWPKSKPTKQTDTKESHRRLRVERSTRQ